MKAVQNIKEQDEKRAELLQAIQAHIQLATEVTQDVDYLEFGTKINNLERVGECVQVRARERCG